MEIQQKKKDQIAGTGHFDNICKTIETGKSEE